MGQGAIARFAGGLGDLVLARRGLGASLLGLVLALLLLGSGPRVVGELSDAWFDLMNRVWTRPAESQPVVIVAIDEQSVAEVGAWPWPRAMVARLFDRIAAAAPAAVGVDIIFSEAGGVSPASLAKRSGAPPEAKAWLENQPSEDDVLAAAIRGGPFVLGVGDRGVAPGAAPEGLIAPIERTGDADPGPLRLWLPPFEPLRALEEFRTAAADEGVVAAGRSFDGVMRRTGQVYDLGGALAPGLATAMLRVASNASRIVAVTSGGGVDSLVLMAGADPVFQVLTEPDGAVRPWFNRRDPALEVPAIALLQDDDELARLENKFVLVGYTAAGGMDERISPLGEVVPGVEAHRQTLEGIFDGVLLDRPDWAPRAETAAAVLLALLAAFLPLRLPIVGGAAVGFGLAAAPLAASFALYAALRLVLDGATPALAALLAGAPAFLAYLALSERERRRTAQVRARLDGEMEAAKRIQMGILPDSRGAFPGETRFEVAASMEPARTVGGDLFDFFLLDDSRLFFLVGDVAGKGPEASLFMAISKALCKSAALRDRRDIGRTLTQANAEIARDNPATMFVTAFAGMLDVETGRLDFCCAGHEPPWRMSAGGARERLEGEGGPPLCLLDDFEYPTDSVDLAPGDMIVVVTDGVTEAADRAGELFGAERTEAAVAALAGAATAAEALDRLTAPVHAFAAGAEPADDLTALVVIWRGPGAAAA